MKSARDNLLRYIPLGIKWQKLLVTSGIVVSWDTLLS
jgi:hypothetical protein